MKSEKIKELAEKLRNGEDVGFVPLEDLYPLAEYVGADTSLAKNLRGRGFQSNALIDAIEKALAAQQ